VSTDIIENKVGLNRNTVVSKANGNNGFPATFLLFAFSLSLSSTEEQKSETEKREEKRREEKRREEKRWE